MVRTRLLTDLERKLINAYFNNEEGPIWYKSTIYNVIHQVRKLDLTEIEKDLKLIKKVKSHKR